MKDLTQAREFSELPKEAADYIQALEDQLETPITMVSTGPDRTQLMVRPTVQL